jgi:putative SOS response-associated peptidase YedK
VRQIHAEDRRAEAGDHFGLPEEPQIVPSYNIAPTQQISVVLEEPDSGVRWL